MARCEACGDELDQFAYTCTYCSEDHCTEHRLPEDHSCAALERETSSDGPWFQDRLSSQKRASRPGAPNLRSKKRIGLDPDTSEFLKGNDRKDHDGDVTAENVPMSSDTDDPPIFQKPRPKPNSLDPDDLETYHGFSDSRILKRESREKHSGPDLAPDGSLIYPDEHQEPTEHTSNPRVFNHVRIRAGAKAVALVLLLVVVDLGVLPVAASL